MTQRNIALRKALNDVDRLEQGDSLEQFADGLLDAFKRKEASAADLSAVADLLKGRALYKMAQLKQIQYAHEVRTEATLLGHGDVIEAEPKQS